MPIIRENTREKKIVVYPEIGDKYYIILQIPDSIARESEMETDYVDTWLNDHAINVDCWDDAE